MIPALVFVAVILLTCGTFGWRMIGRSDFDAPRYRRVCKGGYSWSAHTFDKTLEVGSPNAPVTHTMCSDCTAIWNRNIDNLPPLKRTA